MGRLRRQIHPHADAGLHALRHTFLTEAGEYTDPFTLQYVAGHDTIKTTMRYVHPREETVREVVCTAGRIWSVSAECAGSVQNQVQLICPQPGIALSHCCIVVYRVRKWWNWQTHHLEGVAPKGVGVQIPPSAP